MSYIALASQTLVTNSTTVTFNSIPASIAGKNLRDLQIVIKAQPIGTNPDLALRFNGDTSGSYSYITRGGTATGISSAIQTNNIFFILQENANPDDNEIGLWRINILDYSITNKHKNILCRSDTIDATEFLSGRWANTAAISSITIFSNSGLNFIPGTTFSIYGIEG